MRKETALLSGFIIFKFIIQYSLVDPVYELHRDEFLHIDQAKHLAWGYYSVPPLTSWISWLVLALGGGEFWVKFFPALFGAFTLLAVWKIIEELKGNLFALALGGIAVLFSVLFRINMLFQPNSFDILAWTFVFYTLVKYTNSNNNKWLYIGTIAFALGFLNKYNIAFLLIGLVPALLISSQRKIFANKHLYFALAIGLIIISPNLYWQYQNNFPVFHHMKELAGTQLVNINRTDFLKEQILFFLGSIFVIIAAFVSFFKYVPFKKYQYLFFSFLITLLLFIYLKAKGYYAIGLYPVLLAFGAVYIEKITFRKYKYLSRTLAITIPLLLFIPFVRVAFPGKSPQEIAENSKPYKDLGLLRWEDGKDHELPQDFADMLGWKEMAEKVDKAYTLLPASENTLVLCDNYGQAGAVNFYSKTKNINALSFNADYTNWFPDSLNYTNAILVKDDTDDDRNREREKPLFKSVVLLDSVQHPFARERGTRIYLLRKQTGNANEVLRKEIELNKKRD